MYSLLTFFLFYFLHIFIKSKDTNTPISLCLHFLGFISITVIHIHVSSDWKVSGSSSTESSHPSSSRECVYFDPAPRTFLRLVLGHHSLEACQSDGFFIHDRFTYKTTVHFEHWALLIKCLSRSLFPQVFLGAHWEPPKLLVKLFMWIFL